MSNFQFIEYAAKRRIERKLEDASKRQKGERGGKGKCNAKNAKSFKGIF